MRFDGIGLVDKPKLVKILHAVEVAELAGLYAALKGADESLRRSFLKLLSLNPIKGAALARTKLIETSDPMTAVRAAAVCLLVVRIAGQEN